MEKLGAQLKFDGMKTIRVSGTVDVDGKTLPFKCFRKRASLMRLIVDVDGVDMETVYDGKTVGFLGRLAQWKHPVAVDIG